MFQRIRLGRDAFPGASLRAETMEGSAKMQRLDLASLLKTPRISGD